VFPTLFEQSGAELCGCPWRQPGRRAVPAVLDCALETFAVETRDFVTGAWGLVPLAGPANRQGRIAADSIGGRETAFRGVQATGIIGFFVRERGQEANGLTA